MRRGAAPDTGADGRADAWENAKRREYEKTLWIETEKGILVCADQIEEVRIEWIYREDGKHIYALRAKTTHGIYPIYTSTDKACVEEKRNELLKAFSKRYTVYKAGSDD